MRAANQFRRQMRSQIREEIEKSDLIACIHVRGEEQREGEPQFLFLFTIDPFLFRFSRDGARATGSSRDIERETIPFSTLTSKTTRASGDADI